jgi:predicted amidophosphoribosyltransferase
MRGVQQLFPSVAFEQIIDLVFPTVCLDCGNGVGRVLCESCLARLAHSCSRSELDPAFDHLEHHPLLKGFRAAGPYTGVIKELVLRLKSQGKPYAFPLARLMVAAAGNDPDYIAPDAIYYVPSGRTKVRERGHNPAEVLACAVSRLLGRPVSHSLEKIKATKEQDQLPAALRWSNVSGAFRCRPGFKARGPVLLIDDVLTTGTTARACAGALLDAGADAVHALVAARTVLRHACGVT